MSLPSYAEPTAQLHAGDGAGSAVAKRRMSRRVAVDLVAIVDCLGPIAGVAFAASVIALVGGQPVRILSVLQIGLLSAIILFLSLRGSEMYDLRKLHEFPVRPAALAWAQGLAVAAVLGIGLPAEVTGRYFWLWPLLSYLSGLIVLVAGRHFSRRVLATMTAAGHFDSGVAVFGAGEIAARVHQDLLSSQCGVRLVGVFDDRIQSDRVDSKGIAVTGRLEDLLDAGRAGAIDQIIIALPPGAHQRIADIVRKLEHLPVSVHVVTHIATDLIEPSAAHRVSKLGSIGLIDVKRKALADWAPIIKRIEDYALALALLVALSPLLVLISAAVKFDSRGPVLFRQRRRGLNGNVFQVFKFRTMTVTEDGAEVRQATANDGRVTRVGRFLRRTSLDELPQLWNVLRGEMSLVGPRPHALVHDDEWSRLLERYANRHQVKPGITGLSQIRGLRGETDTTDKIERRVASDLEYIARWSLVLDLWILIMTAVAMATGRNAH